MTARILLVESDHTLAKEVETSLREQGGEVIVVSDCAMAQDCIQDQGQDLDVVITELSLPDGTGFEIMDTIRHNDSLARVVVLASEDDTSILTALSRGAADYLVKPIDMDALSAAVMRAEQVSIRPKAQSEAEQLKSVAEYVSEHPSVAAPRSSHPPVDLERWRKHNVPSFLGHDTAFMRVFGLIERVADTDCSVLVTGESGTGKELVAKALHTASQRKNKPFLVVNCAAIPDNLLESELFGHTRGSFTGATNARVGKFVAAEGGTLFLDEIGELPLALQAKLLRVLQEKEVTPVGENRTQRVNVRVVAATNRDLDAMVDSGEFREDLLYRINVIPIELPPLRERSGDIVELVDTFVQRANATRKRKIEGVAPEAMEILCSYDWPGNVRQLENTIERMVILRSRGVITVEDIPHKVRKAARQRNGKIDDPMLPEDGLDLRDAVERFENALIRQALERTQWNKNQAANILQMNRTTLVEKLKKKGLLDPGPGSEVN